VIEIPEVLASISIVDLIKNIHSKLNQEDPKMLVIPDNTQAVADVLFVLQGGGAEHGDFDQYYNPEMDATNIVVFLKDHTSKTVQNVISNCQKLISESGGKDYEFKLAAGRAGIVAATNESVTNEQIFLTVTVFVITILCASIFIQSLIGGLLLVIPLIIANFLTIGYMANISLGLNIQTLPVSTIAVGIGVDYGLYLLARIKEEFKGDLDGAIKKALISAGIPIIFTGVIIIAGVFFFNFSKIKFQADMANLFSIVSLFQIIATLILLPALIKVIKPKFILGERQE